MEQSGTTQFCGLHTYLLCCSLSLLHLCLCLTYCLSRMFLSKLSISVYNCFWCLLVISQLDLFRNWSLLAGFILNQMSYLNSLLKMLPLMQKSWQIIHLGMVKKRSLSLAGNLFIFPSFPFFLAFKTSQVQPFCAGYFQYIDMRTH